MYTLNLADGTSLTGLRRLHHYVFQMDEEEGNRVYFALSDSNLAFATLYEDDEMVDVLFDYTRQNYIKLNGVIEFRLAPLAEIQELMRKKEAKWKWD